MLAVTLIQTLNEKKNILLFPISFNNETSKDHQCR